jgi:hypothetical protein
MFPESHSRLQRREDRGRCFKFRNKIGIDVAVEALKDFTRHHRGGANDLARFARICRVSRIMHPYLDAVP